MTGDRSLRDYDLESGDEAVIDDPLVFLAQPDSLIVTREFAERNGIADRHEGADAHHGRREAVHGARHHEVGRADAGLRRQPGGDGHLRGADGVRPRAGPSIAWTWRSHEGVALADGPGGHREGASGPGFQVEPPSSRGQQIDSVVRVYSFTANVNSAFALFIGMFIIYNSFSIAVAQRRREIGILRALGASRGQIRTLFLVESGLSGLVGSVVGPGVRRRCCRAASRCYISDLIAGVYGARRAHDRDRDASPWLMIVGLLMGVVTSVVAGFIPARNASRVDPIQALQKGRYQVLSAGENRIRRIAALILGSASVALLAFAGRSMAALLRGLRDVAARAAAAEPDRRALADRALRPVLRRFRPVEGALAADSLIQAPRRTSATVTALMLSIALVVALGGIATAVYESIMDWTTTALNPDLFVTASQSLTERNFRFPASLGDQLEDDRRDRRGAARAQPPDRLQGHAGDDRGRGGEVDGRARQAAAGRRARPRCTSWPPQGKGVILSDNFARAAGPPLRRHHRAGHADRRPPGAHRRPGRGLVGSAGRHPDGPRELHPLVGRRHGERLPPLREAGRAADGRARPHHRALRRDAAAVRADEPGGAVVDRRR